MLCAKEQSGCGIRQKRLHPNRKSITNPDRNLKVTPERSQRVKETHRWIRERASASIRTEYLAERVLFEGRSPYQEILLAENSLLGKYLLLDRDIQSSTSDCANYHEILVHPALLAHPRPQRVLILGGGEGSTLREVLRHQCVKEVVLVERDATVVKVCREHAPELHGAAFHDPRSHLIVGDAMRYLQESTGNFDVILVDLPDAERELYRLISIRLGLDGLFATQAGSGGLQQEGSFLRHYRMVSKHWPKLCPLVSYIPCYQGLWCFLTASHAQLPSLLTAENVQELLIERGITSLQAYDGETHVRVCHLPKHLRKALAHVNQGSG